MNHYTTLSLSLLAAALILGSCSDDGAESFDRAQLIENTGQNVIMATNDEVLAASTTLDEAANTFCGDRTQDNLEAAQLAWVDVKRPLKKAEAFSFGPYRFFGIELNKTIDKWPGRGANIEEILSGYETIDQDYVDGLDYQQRIQGYPAVGYLLFGAPDESSTLDAYTAEATGDRRCDYLTALTQHASGIVAEYHNEWAADGGNYIGEFVNAGKGSDAYGSEQAALTAMVETMIYALDQISMMKLGEPLGTQNGGTPAPDNVEARYSENSLNDARNTLEGVRLLYEGSVHNVPADANADYPKPPSLSDYVRFRQESGDVDQTVRQRLDAASQAIAAIPAPLSQAVVDSPDKVQAAIDAVDALNRALSGEVSTLLGINPTTVEGDND